MHLSCVGACTYIVWFVFKFVNVQIQTSSVLQTLNDMYLLSLFDIKPSNIMVANSNIKLNETYFALIDFGLALPMKSNEYFLTTQGTLGYVCNSRQHTYMRCNFEFQIYCFPIISFFCMLTLVVDGQRCPANLIKCTCTTQPSVESVKRRIKRGIDRFSLVCQLYNFSIKFLFYSHANAQYLHNMFD